MTGLSIVMITTLAMLSLFGATILSRPWMRWAALGMGVSEIAILAFLLIVLSK